MLIMYEKAIENVLELPVIEQNTFKERLRKIMESASGIGWGYHDGICELYSKSFEDQ